MGESEPNEAMESVARLRRDLRQAARTLSEAEVRFLVDAYYTMQEDRKRSKNQVRALTESGEPHAVLLWFANQTDVLERSIKSALDIWSRHDPVAAWARRVKGIGPVISAGLAAHIDLTKATTAGAIWRFAGLDPTQKWEKGQKRPWNATLKTLCWKVGESFVKVSGHEDALYGRLWKERKAQEWERNLSGGNAEHCAKVLATKRIGKTTLAYRYYAGLISPTVVRRHLEGTGKVPELKATKHGDEAPMLPPGHVHQRAKRWTVKLFLSHYHQRGREILGLPIVAPYPLAHLGHGHAIEAPE